MLDDKKIEQVKKICNNNNDRNSLIQVLHATQALFGYLPKEALQIISTELDTPMSEIYGVATFYSQFTLEPKGEHVIKVCLGTACYVKGSQAILERLENLLDVKAGKTTSDGKFTLETTRCLGSCGLAPVIMVDEKVYGKLIPDDVVRIIEE